MSKKQPDAVNSLDRDSKFPRIAKMPFGEPQIKFIRPLLTAALLLIVVHFSALISNAERLPVKTYTATGAVQVLNPAGTVIATVCTTETAVRFE